MRIKRQWRYSKAGMTAALIFLGLAAVIFLGHLYSVKTNPADSGESAIGFALFTLPWLAIVSKQALRSEIWDYSGYILGWFCVVVNSFIVYWVVSALSKKRD